MQGELAGLGEALGSRAIASGMFAVRIEAGCGETADEVGCWNIPP
jgi:hypothetical protein